MPSGYTHILLAKTFVESSNLTNHNLGLNLAENIKYFQLGALGPDLPYSQQLGLTNRNVTKQADSFHYDYTNKIPIRAFNKIKAMNESEEKDQSFAFFLGYASHIVADGIIHPFVRDKVGDYKGNETDHRTLEMRLDVLFMHELTKQTGRPLELNYTNLHDEILDPLSRKFDHISDLFVRLIYEVYGPRYPKEEIHEWIRDMHKVLSIAESENNQFYAFLPLLKDYLFSNHSEVYKAREEDILLKTTAAKGRENNFLSRDVNFFADCIPKFYSVFKSIALAAHKFVYENGPTFGDRQLPAINLDTGRPLNVANGNNLDAKAVYWEIG